MTNRKDVYKAIDSERNYQIKRHEMINTTNPHADENHSIADWLIYMEHHIEAAKHYVYMLRFDEAMDEIRKTAALGVACMEYKGAPRRP